MALQIVLVVVGLAIAGANIYPLVTYFLAGPSPTGSTTAPMFWTIYATLGVFLVLAAKNPSAHRSLIAYAIWSSVAHTAVMALMATQLPAKRAELLVGVAVTGLSAALLFVFARISAGRERVIALFLVFVAAPLAAQTPLQGRVDSVFKQYASTETPGCAIGVAQRGRVLLERAFGMADLERGVALTPASIFEAGSVSKQFTAAAVLLLARDGKLSLDDPVRRWVPEVPDFGQPLTLRHLLHHMSGLRDWGSIAGIAGWPRNTRALDHYHVLQIIARMRELNAPPGTEYEYSNSNYNLLAIAAERASGESLPAFTRRRIFEPLGMTSTSWRDDAMRVVRGRALSYDKDSSGWHGERAVENIYGNCCLLTTVGDLLKWNAAFDSTRLGAGLRAEQERRGVLANGQAITYAAGLFVDTWRGQPWVGHSGATAGYRANLVRYTQPSVSVAVLCNAGNADPESMSDSVAGALVPFAAPTTPPAPVRAPAAPSAIADKAGLYRTLRDMRAQRLRVREGRLESENGNELVPIDRGGTTFQAARGGSRLLFQRRPDGHYDVRLVSPASDTVSAEWVADADTGRAALAAYVGVYESPEAETTVRIAFDSAGALAMTRVSNSGGPWRMRPIYRDGFIMVPGVLVFTRDGAGRVNGFRFATSRVRNLKFERR